MATQPDEREMTAEEKYRAEYAREWRDGIDRSTLEKPLATADTPLGEIDVSRPELYALDRWQPVFEKLRKEDPIHWCEDSVFGGFWSLTT